MGKRQRAAAVRDAARGSGTTGHGSRLGLLQPPELWFVFKRLTFSAKDLRRLSCFSIKSTYPNHQLMKKSICLAASLLALNLTPVFGQPANPGSPSSPVFQQRLQSIIQQANTQNQPPANPPPVLTKFNLDFPGGTPAQLVEAIEKAMGKPLNAIIPTEDADLQMPPLKMSDVVVPQLFAALKAASVKTVTVPPSRFGGYSQYTGDYGFQTADSPLSDASIWYFHANKPSMSPEVPTEKVCRFYSLDHYLNSGFTVDDITTAIQTGWKMAGITSPPELNYHKETKLLIAFGEPNELETIQTVLGTLPTDNDYPALRGQVLHLQLVVDQLSKKIATQNTSSNSLPEEKSGK